MSGRSLTLVGQDHIYVSPGGLLLGIPIWLIAPSHLVVMSLHAYSRAALFPGPDGRGAAYNSLHRPS